MFEGAPVVLHSTDHCRSVEIEQVLHELIRMLRFHAERIQHA